MTELKQEKADYKKDWGQVVISTQPIKRTAVLNKRGQVVAESDRKLSLDEIINASRQ